MSYFAAPLSGEYWAVMGCLVLARAADMGSTWLATPSLALEANPIARRLGWRWGCAVNAVICAALPLWPLPAIMLGTTSALVAARNFQHAWLMRSLGEARYRAWMAERLNDAGRGLFLACLVGQTLPVAAVGLALVSVSKWNIPSLAIGAGVIAYAAAVAGFTLLALWRARHDFQFGAESWEP